jgi:hypothetical protein
VIAHTEATNAGNKHSFSVVKIDDSISSRRKKQQDMGRYKGMIYSKKEAKMDKLTWLVLIFDNVKGGGEGKDCKGMALFQKVGVWVRSNGIVVSWLRLQTASEGVPHPYHMYTKCFSTLICC